MIRKALPVISTTLAAYTIVICVVSSWWKVGYDSQSEPYWGITASRFGLTVYHFEFAGYDNDPRINDPEFCVWALWSFGNDLADACDGYRDRWYKWRYEWRRAGGIPTNISTWIHFPLWQLSAALLIYPTIAFIRGPLRRYRRRKRGRCIHCGYDLTDNISGTCPECGQPITPNKTTNK